MRREGLVCLVLIAATLAVFWPVGTHEFINYDIAEYITQNTHVQGGLASESLIWAFTATHAGNWHPLTWLSHMLDCQLYGLNPRGHHLSNLLFHLANTVFLFLALNRMTRTLWQSAFVAALFALHPLHIESVAWVAERKDVLSTLFWMLTLFSYAGYVQRPGPKRYLLTLILFALGLMAKPMLVTLPCVLLLLDFWPLDRFQIRPVAAEMSPEARTVRRAPTRYSVGRLLWEKAPFFVLAAASSIVTIFAQRMGRAVSPTDLVPLTSRIANALVAYVSYMGKMIWPHKLAVFYPLTQNVALWKAAGAGVVLLSISILVVRSLRRHPYLTVGWLWYLGTLVPVIGLVQVGGQSMADRYTYVPLIGLFMMIAWGVPGIIRGWRHQRTVVSIAAGVLLVALTVRTGFQLRHWQNSMALFGHALEVTTDNYVAHSGLGYELAEQGRLDEAINHYAKALQLHPNYTLVRYNLAQALGKQGRLDEAISHYSEALQRRPGYAEAHLGLGVALAMRGRLEEAMEHFSEAVRLKPDSVKAHANLGRALAMRGRLDEAITHFSEALRLEPNDVELHHGLGVALAMRGRIGEAVTHFSAALETDPDHVQAHYNLGLALVQQGKVKKAVEHFSEALRLKPDFVEARSSLERAVQLLGRSTDTKSHNAEP